MAGENNNESTIMEKLEYLEGTKNSIKNAIISKGQEISENDTFRSYAVKIADIETGTDTSDATATANDIISPKTAYVDGQKITGTIPNNGQLNYTPATSQQNIPAGYTSGGTIDAVTSSIDSNISANNIKEGVNILGVTGTVKEGKLSNEDYENLAQTLTTIIEGESTPVEKTYTELSCIRSLGAIVNVGYVPKNNARVECKYKLHNYSPKLRLDWQGWTDTEANNPYLFGVMNTFSGADSSTQNKTWAYIPSGVDNLAAVWCYSVSATDNAESDWHDYVQYNGDYTLTTNGSSATMTCIGKTGDGSVINATNKYAKSSLQTGNAPIAIFGCNLNNSDGFTPKAYSHCSESLYYLKIYEGNTLVRHYVGAIDSDNEICIYDKVTKTAYYADNGILLSGGVL